jgi:hypothetical protein
MVCRSIPGFESGCRRQICDSPTPVWQTGSTRGVREEKKQTPIAMAENSPNLATMAPRYIALAELGARGVGVAPSYFLPPNESARPHGSPDDSFSERSTKLVEES